MAIKLLSIRSYSEAELRKRVNERAHPQPELLDQCVERLKALGYLDDFEFARSFVNHRLSLRAVGRARLARELATRRVNRKIIDQVLDEAFEEVEEETLIDRAIDKRVRTHGLLKTKQDAKRLFDYLARLGFGHDLIMRRIRKLRSAGDASEDE